MDGDDEVFIVNIYMCVCYVLRLKNFNSNKLSAYNLYDVSLENLGLDQPIIP